MFSTYPGQVVVDHPVKVPIEHRFDPYVDNGGYVFSFRSASRDVLGKALLTLARQTRQDCFVSALAEAYDG
jgi:hypothetical protein